MLAPRAAHATNNTQTHHLAIENSLNIMGNPCNVSGRTPQPKKKRIRRTKLELEFLRCESTKLEDELAQLLQSQAKHHLNPTCASSAVPQTKNVVVIRGYRMIAPRVQRKPSVWKEIAGRQSKERGHALARNLELRTQLEAELKLGKQLMQILDRQYYTKVLVEDKRVQSVLKQDDGFKKLLERAENTLLEMKAVLRGSAFSDNNACFLDTFVEKENENEVFVMQSNVSLPFDAKATANGLWKVLSSDIIDEYCYYHQVAQKSDTVVAQTFGIRYVDDGTDVDFYGKYTFSRFKDGECIVIVWVAECEPVELNGTKCCGIQCQTTGWIQLSEQRSVKMNGTLARAYSRLSMNSHNGKFSEVPLLHWYIGLAQRMHDRFMASFSSVLVRTLIEEDWKMNGGWVEGEGDFRRD